MGCILGIPQKNFTRTPYQHSGPGGPDGAPPPPPPQMGSAKPSHAALEVKNGKVIAKDQDLTGVITDTKASDIKLTLDSDETGGIYVAGEGSDYTVEHADILISGSTEVFDMMLSGVAVDDHGILTLKNCKVHMDGRQRLATAASGSSILKVFDSLLVYHGEAWPVSQPEVNTVMNGNMSKAPVFLEIEGNMRTHCTVSNSQSYFYDSTIIADSWAALSTDIADGHVYLEANNCNVITTRAGYGTYADTNCHTVLNHCTLQVQHMVGIISGEAKLELNHCTAKCGNYVVLNHVVGGGDNDAMLTQVSDISIVGGSYQCEDSAVIVKSCNADIVMDHAKIHSYAHTLLKSRINDDPCAPDAAGKNVYGIHAQLKNGAYDGDILHTDSQRPMSVTLEQAQLSGAITGNVYLTFDQGSRWTATGDSNVILNGDVLEGQIDADEGVTICAVGGAATEKTLPSGGKLIITTSI